MFTQSLAHRKRSIKGNCEMVVIAINLGSNPGCVRENPMIALNSNLLLGRWNEP